MYESGTVDHTDDGFFEQPAPVLAVGRECPPQGKVAVGKLLFEPAAKLFGLSIAVTLCILDEPAVALLRSLVVRKRGVLGLRHVAQVADEIHRLMVADEDVNPAAGIHGLGFEPHQQVHGVARARPAVENIADDNEMGCATRPRHLLVDDACALHRFDHGRVRAVHVSDRDDAFSAVHGPLCGFRQRSSEQDDRKQNRRPGNQVLQLHGRSGPAV